MKAIAFFLSDGTGITVETLGHTLLSQFDAIEFQRVRRPYLKTPEDVAIIVDEINNCRKDESQQVLVFSTLVDSESRILLHECKCMLFDLYDIFIKPMEIKLNVKASKKIGRAHGMGEFNEYQPRIDALNYTMENDDGITTQNYAQADVIIVGVSRTGKTPTSLYLALNYGIRAANYPLTMDDLEVDHLPKVLNEYHSKIFGLTINPTRLHHIRQQRRSKSRYAELAQCQFETRSTEVLYRKSRIPFLDTSTMSIEEIATSILQTKKIKRRINY